VFWYTGSMERIRRLTGIILATGLLSVALLDAQAADEQRGRMLYENHCGFCHASVVHVREQHKVRNAAELRSAIQHWSGESKLKWQENDVNDVQLYLNRLYYHFAPESAPR
jgi:hypothetical protein